MSKDLKIGMIIGVVLLIAATLMISFLSEGSLIERLKKKHNKETFTLPDDGDMKPGPEDTKNTNDKTDKNTGKIHVVKEGETIYDIAYKYYGNRKMIIKIIDENPQIPDDNKLTAGMKIKIPE